MVGIEYSEMSDALSLHGSSSEFSGFSDVEDIQTVSRAGTSASAKPVSRPSGSKQKLKSVAVRPAVTKGKSSSTSVSKKSSDVNKKSSDTHKKSSDVCEKSDVNSILDISKLTSSDIESLRAVLGIQNVPQSQSVDSEDDEQFSEGNLRKLPNIRVQLDANDISDNENVDPSQDFSANFGDALFGESLGPGSSGLQIDDDWDLPKLKAPKKGNPVSATLANLINTSCTNQCDIDSFAEKYKVPENCENASPPTVNQEVWRILNKQGHLQDKALVDIQNLVSMGIAPIVGVADILRRNNSQTPEIKSLLSDTLTLLGQIQYHLSLRRRYMIRPLLKKKYSRLCNMSMPITKQLFGDDFSKEVKNCDSLGFLGRDPSWPRQQRKYSRGRGSGYQQYYGSQQQYGSQQSVRYHPYPARGQSFNRRAGSRGGRKTPVASATATTATSGDPNEQA